MRICSGAGCLRAIADELRYCDECKPTPLVVDAAIREHTIADRERYAALYTGARWQRVAHSVIKRQPLCALCELRISTLADHIVPAGIAIQQARDSGLYLTDKYAGFFLLSNLQGLCALCHHLKTIQDKTHVGPWPNVLEAEAKRPRKVWSF